MRRRRKRPGGAGFLGIAAWRCAVVFAVVGVGADAVDDLIRLARSNASMQVRFAAVNRVVDAGEEAVPGLLGALEHENPAVREDAVRALGRLGADDAVQPLIGLLSDDVAAVRSATAEALGLIGDEMAVGPLLTVLESEDELDRRGALVGLGSLKAAAALPAIVRQCSSDNWEVRWRAAVALGKLGARSAAPVVSRLTVDAHAVTAACADWAVSAIAGRPDTRALEENLRNADAGTVWASAWALGVIGTTEAREALQAAAAAGDGVRVEAAEMVLRWLGTPAEIVPEEQHVSAAAEATPPEQLLDLEDRWEDRYGALAISVTRPRVPIFANGSPPTHVSDPFVVRLGSGDILLSVGSTTDPDTGPRQTWRSADGGKTWQPQATLVRRLDAMGVLRNGTVLAYDGIAFKRLETTFVTQLCISRDGGRTFGPLQLATLRMAPGVRARVAPPGVVGHYAGGAGRWSDRALRPFVGQPAELEDGTLAACGPAANGFASVGGVVCYVSDDRGLTWARRALVVDEGSAARTVVLTSAGRLLCLVRTREDERLATYESADRGESWVLTGHLPHRAGGFDLCRMQNGILVAAYVGEALRIVFNVDGGGRNWTDRITIANVPRGWEQDVAICETSEEGSLLLAYTCPPDGEEDRPPVLKTVTVRSVVQ